MFHQNPCRPVRSGSLFKCRKEKRKEPSSQNSISSESLLQELRGNQDIPK
jgi:hypothetical protein